jgi:chitodextrinase
MRFKSVLSLLLGGALGCLGIFGAANAAEPIHSSSCQSYESWVGDGKINIVDFTATTGGATSPFKFRLKINTIGQSTTDGYLGPVVKGTMTFSYPRQNNPELPYVKADPYPAMYTHGPAFGEKVDFQAREIGCNLFEVHWKETHKGDTVTHVQDFNRQQVCTNITNINRTPIPAEFDPFDINAQMNNKTLFADGGPVAKDSFAWFPLCGRMSQSPESAKVWEDKLHYLVFVAT